MNESLPEADCGSGPSPAASGAQQAAAERSEGFHPTQRRYEALDVCRGLALYGVLIVNLLSGFRITLFEHLLGTYEQGTWFDQATELLVAFFIEFKAFALFAFLFGVGIAIQQERASRAGIQAEKFLARRFVVLLCMGLLHMLFVWSGDILTLYAVCGFAILPVLQLPVKALFLLGIAAILSTPFLPWGSVLPSSEQLHADMLRAMHDYTQSCFWCLVPTRAWEVQELIAGLLLLSAPKTLGMMLMGVSAWKHGILQSPAQHRRLLWIVAVGGACIGFWCNGYLLSSGHVGEPNPLLRNGAEVAAQAPLALAYGAAVMLLVDRAGERLPAFVRACGAVGRMSLTNYLVQSFLFGLLFYGYGLGWLGQLGSFRAVVLGTVVYALQLAFSVGWLKVFKYGPMEYVWRRLSYDGSSTKLVS